MSCQLIGICALTPEAQAAWAQAVFSVIAIGVAILVPAMQHRARVREERETKRRRASVVRQLLSSNFENAIQVTNQLASHYRTEIGMRFEKVDALALGDVEDLLHHGILYDLWRWHEDELDLLDPQAMNITLQVIRKADQYRAVHAMAQTGSSQLRLRRFQDSASLLVTLLEDIGRLASSANLIVRRDQENAEARAK